MLYKTNKYTKQRTQKNKQKTKTEYSFGSLQNFRGNRRKISIIESLMSYLLENVTLIRSFTYQLKL